MSATECRGRLLREKEGLLQLPSLTLFSAHSCQTIPERGRRAHTVVGWMYEGRSVLGPKKSHSL